MPNNTHLLFTGFQLGHILQTSRKAKKWSQTQIAIKLGLSQSRVSHLEAHAEELSFEQLMKWCAVLGLELSIGLRQPSAELTSSDW